jgi:glycosyltransferase involved in cell wall biosynthesis
MRSKLRSLVDTSRIPRVYFLGYRPDIPALLRDSDAIVLVSKREGLPRSIMEAMAAGRAVICCDIRGTRDLVENGRTGVLVPLDDVGALTQSLECVALNPEWRRDMGDRGKLRIVEYGLQNVLDEVWRIYVNYL